MKLYLPFSIIALLSIGIMPPVLAEPLSVSAQPNPNQALGTAVPDGEMEKSSPQASSSQFPRTTIPRLSEIEFPLTRAEGLFQESVPNSAGSSPVAQVESGVAQVTSVRLNPTDIGFEVILETQDGDSLEVETRSEGNSLIADIPNAVLVLPEGDEFRADNPAEGISSVSVTQLDANSIQVAVIGETGTPTVEVISTESGLTLSLAPVLEDGEEELIGDGEETELEIVVTATRTAQELPKVPRSVTVITRDEIEQQATVTRDVQDILAQTVPGYGPPTERAFTDTTASLRGRAPLVLIDGVPQNTNSGNFGRQLQTIDPASIERIEVVRGPSAIYGQGATGGVINIITRKPNEEQRLRTTVEVGVTAALGELEAESFGNYQEYGLEINEGDVDLIINLSRDDVGASFDAEGDRLAITQGIDESETFNLLGKVGWDINDQQRLELSASHYSTERDTNAISDPIIDDIPGIQKPRAIVFEEGIDFIGTSPQSDRNTALNLNYTNQNVFGSQLGLQAYFRDNTVYTEGRDRRNRDQGIDQRVVEAENWGARLQIETPFNQEETVSLLWGADYANEENSFFRNLFDSEEFDNSEGRVFRKIGEETIVPPYDVESLGLFAQLQWDVSDRVALSGGARYDRFDLSVPSYTSFLGDEVEGGKRNFDDIVFNVGAVYQATDEVSLYANYAQGFSVPNLVDVLFAPPAGFNFESSVRDLQPQKVNNYEIGVRGNWSKVQVSLAGFFNESDLGAALIPTDDFFELVRAPERIYGIEATLDWQPGGGFSLGGTLGWSEGEVDLPDDDEGYLALGNDRIQPLKLTAFVEHQTTPGWRNRLQAVLVGNRDRAFEDGIDLSPVESYVVLDYLGSIQLGPGMLQIGIRNLLDNQYFQAYDQSLRSGFESFVSPASGRTISVGYRVSW
ncbi:MAG: TonB-dependent receptor [Symplocastrum torsivum CPER-KK1]|jgi:iron complex outermembrane receptor protein|uniref:TonB-dependent receptor n=1 Tax=Symplocastrum torsivum CPER-KK1 TaxID=450513 RepID=A0A951PG56_9CYAN|nr:TonB-dependent receptor [Symplocastrum torsivum CPER-KK1]